MSAKQLRASLSKGRSSWCVIFRHPVCLASDGHQKLRVRRGLGTSDESEALVLVNELNEILGNEAMWSLGSRQLAEAKYDRRVVSAFYDHMRPDSYDGWCMREEAIPLPGGKGNREGYARVLFVGTTGAGKTTIVRQILGTDPEHERFPSISAAKTTTCDLELVCNEGSYKAVVTFLPRDRVRQYIAECVSASVISKLDRAPEREVVRRFLEHSEQRFRLSYILGNPMLLGVSDDTNVSDEGDAVGAQPDETAEISDDERKKLLHTFQEYLDAIDQLVNESRTSLVKAAEELGINMETASPEDRDVLQELVEDDLTDREKFHELVDTILEDVETRFDYLTNGELTRGRDEWPIKWTHSAADDQRPQFIRLINRFCSNYAPNFGRLLTPLVEGIRVSGPFRPEWQTDGAQKLVLMDGQGIGHIADSSSSLSTSITRRFQQADAIVLVDNAAQPMQAGSCAVLQSLAASGHESKLVVAFTHFDEVTGDNLVGTSAKKDHVLGSLDNAVHAIGKAFGRETESALRRLIPGRVFFLANVQQRLKDTAKFTLSELRRLLQNLEAAVVPSAPVEHKPVYDVANLVLAIQKATQEFHDRWHGLLGMGSRSGVFAEHWARIKALTRRLGVFRVDEYDTLRPVADLIRLFQTEVSQFLANPLGWEPSTPPDDSNVRIAAIDAIRKEVFAHLHELSRKRILDDRVKGWIEAYEHRGRGSTRDRARDVASLYEGAAPIPIEMPGPNANEFLFEVRELIADSIEEGGGTLRGWRRNGSAPQG